jgi:putative membrane protein
MNFSMAIDGLLFWWLVLDHRPRPPARLSPGVRVLAALAVILPQILLGAYLSFTSTDLYPIYSLCGRAFAGIPAITDQHIGGLILWIPASMMSVIAALIAFTHWLRLDTQGRLPRHRRLRGLSRAAAAATGNQPSGPTALAGRTGKAT